ncbi:hypothetical protein [uncultured Acetatifactor sp.]|uniref:hypothetical protein n=1 Tax=uncultured Acetatifactor sp. TaxID=1671927 RepID=UPI00260E908B|nr:hypothetical protein [uncultured Acetatifactor sp.]
MGLKKRITNMKNKFKKAIITTVSVLSISLLPLPELAVPTLFPPEPFETDSGEEPGDDNGCEPLSDRPDKDIDKSFNDSEL